MLQTLSDIATIIQHAHLFDPKKWNGGRMSVPSPEGLYEAVQRLFALLNERQVDYVLVGGIAVLHYVRGRNTQDIDLIMALPDVARIPEIHIEERDVFFLRGTFESLRIDILLTENPVFKRVREEFTTRVLLGSVEIPIATVEGLLLLKLYALPSLYRQGDFQRVAVYESDIAALMYTYNPDMEMLLNVLEPYVGEGDLQALREIVHEIASRTRRFRDT